MSGGGRSDSEIKKASCFVLFNNNIFLLYRIVSWRNDWRKRAKNRPQTRVKTALTPAMHRPETRENTAPRPVRTARKPDTGNGAVLRVVRSA